MDILEVKKADLDGQKYKDLELASIFQLILKTKRKTSRTPHGVIELALPDDWVEEIMMHVLHNDPRSPKGKFPRTKHNYMVLRVPVTEETP